VNSKHRLGDDMAHNILAPKKLTSKSFKPFYLQLV